MSAAPSLAVLRAGPLDPDAARRRARTELETYARDPRVWGRGAWRLLFAGVLANYPRAVRTPRDRATASALLATVEGMARFLPCPECRKHFRERLARHPLRGTPAAESRWGVARWLYEAKDAVNRRVGADPSPGTPEEAVASLLLHDLAPPTTERRGRTRGRPEPRAGR